MKDPYDTILKRFRDVFDTGLLEYMGNDGKLKKLNLSNATIIFTSNELPESLGLPKRELNQFEAAARTFRNHDKSLINRLPVVEFVNFHASDYYKLLNPIINEIKSSYLKVKKS